MVSTAVAGCWDNHVSALSRFQVRLNRILLGWGKRELVDPSGDGAFGQAGREMIGQPRIGVARRLVGSNDGDAGGALAP